MFKGKIHIFMHTYDKTYVEKIFTDINSILKEKNIKLIFNTGTLNSLLYKEFYEMSFEGEYVPKLMELFTSDKDIINVYRSNDLGFMRVVLLFNNIKLDDEKEYVKTGDLVALSFDISRPVIDGEKKYTFIKIYDSYNTLILDESYDETTRNK